MIKAFTEDLPPQALTFARRWGQMAPVLAPHFKELRRNGLSNTDRERTLDDLYRDACIVVTPSRAWRSLPDEDDDDETPW